MIGWWATWKSLNDEQSEGDSLRGPRADWRSSWGHRADHMARDGRGPLPDYRVHIPGAGTTEPDHAHMKILGSRRGEPATHRLPRHSAENGRRTSADKPALAHGLALSHED